MTRVKRSSEAGKADGVEPKMSQPDNGDTTDAAEGEGGRWPVERLKPIVEAVVFAAADPIPIKRLREIVEGATTHELRRALEALQEDCRRRGVRLVEVAGGWQLRTAPEQHAYVRRLFRRRPFRLTRAAIETLAIVAYRQPVTRAEVEAVRGVDVSGVLESLVERRLVRVAGRRDVPGHPLVYVTTREFLELFGLKDLKSLPTLPEVGDELAGLAEQAGFDEVGEREAPIIPLDRDREQQDENKEEKEEKEEEEDSESEQATAETVARTDSVEDEAGKGEAQGSRESVDEQKTLH